MTGDLDYFIRESVAHSRTLSLLEARRFLCGLLLLGDEAPELASVRKVFADLTDCDSQLELIASGQMKLPLPSAPKKGRK